MKKIVFSLILLPVFFSSCRKENVDIKQPELTDFNKTHLRSNTVVPFYNEVMAFQNMDNIAMPKPDGVLFMGSSTIRLWPNLDKIIIAGQPVIKRGIGGSQMAQFATTFAPYLTRYKPRKIFLYAGGNDILAGQTPQQITASFDTIYANINRKLPGADLYYLSMKIAPKYMATADMYKKTNAMIKASIDMKAKAHYLDITTLMADSAGMPIRKYYFMDDIHLNEEGYSVLEKALRSWVK